ncbi:MAG TPA: hypothetical protein VFF06_28040 [Polyangia bacterium]|nr:hypothetical protein [Polyangia bacterium]
MGGAIADKLIGCAAPSRSGSRSRSPPLGRFAGEATLPVEDSACHVIRLAAGGGFSGPVYVNCGFAERPPVDP